MVNLTVYTEDNECICCGAKIKAGTSCYTAIDADETEYVWCSNKCIQTYLDTGY